MFTEAVKELDSWVIRQNEESRTEGMALLPPCEIRLLGQSALFEAAVDLPLVGTVDVDVFANYQHSVQTQFAKLLKKRGLLLDPVGHVAWMPQETQYENVYDGLLVKGFIAEPDFVLLSKALKAPNKNRILLVEYLACGASPLFLKLANKYGVDLEQFV